MRDIDQALSDIAGIRAQLASSTRFHGFAPVAVAGSGAFAFLAAVAQTLWPERLASDPSRYVAVWVSVAVASAALIFVEGLARISRMHGTMASMMVAGTARQMVPIGVAGAGITVILYNSVSANLWILPGLWQVLIALIGFTSLTSLPKAIIWPAGWYFACGLVVLDLASRGAPLSPWMMGIPFSLGQAAVAVILHRDAERHNAGF
ncbi:hypothetical protein [Novosphingobium sp. SG720]|uniref:hypothetical protein n=1 Tax=Novosphingobium sp. SG720 TaxID=2586998 RepID=UPI001445825C|nr:hypothetical protein [Novosphingobium sp. SG720]NKJ45137.1 hypothetical protein [Novosphingobium sp. SG720]